jgi:nitrite reductase (NADH) large subunit
MSEPLVIIGKGMAATRLVDELSATSLGRHAIAVVGSEPRTAYNRVLLSPLLAGEIPEADIELRPPSWWRARGVSTFYGAAATAIDRGAKTVTLSNGLTLPYGKLVLATGSLPVRPPIPGADLAGIMTFRDIRDVERMRTKAAAAARVVVIGGGLLGLEAAYGLHRAGARVTLLHLMDRLMERQLDATAARLLARSIAARGIDIRLSVTTKRFFGTGDVAGVETGDGEVLPADLVVIATGVRPRIDLAAAAGLATGRGVLVDDGLATSDPDIFAIGECAEHRGQVYGLVEPAYEQARILAARLAGRSATYSGSVLSTNLKVSGVNVFSAGEFEAAEGTQTAILLDENAGIYRKFVIRDGVLVGCILVGDTSSALWYFQLIREAARIDAFRGSLAFGEALCLPMAA